MNLKRITSRLTEDRMFGRKVGAGLLAAYLATGVGLMEINRYLAEKPVLHAEAPSEGIGRDEAELPAGTVRLSADTLDYTDGVIWGWDNRYCELWEMDLFSRIAYLEFWGTSEECCKAGVDSILRLWESGYFGDSLGATLTATCETGAYVYSTYAYAWAWTYDPQGLADMRKLCEDRFTNGPVYTAPFFQLWYYPSWAVPCYQIDNVFFSTWKGW